MKEQLALSIAGAEARRVERERRLDREFAEYHAANPHVYRQLVELARVARRSGATQYGVKGLFEVLRWHRRVQTNDPQFELNNNFTSRFARLIMEREPDLQGFFETRELRS